MVDESLTTSDAPPVGRRRFLMLLPGGIFVGVAAALGIGLTRDPRELPSTLIGRPVPTFDLSPVKGRTLGLSSANLQGEVSLVNVFASWCTACRYEHPLFMARSEEPTSDIQSLMRNSYAVFRLKKN